MIDPNELMRGNLVSILDTQVIGGVTEILDAGNGEYQISIPKAVGISHRNINPIPTTPEWLERLGFERTTHEMPFGTEITYYLLGEIVVFLIHSGFEIELRTRAGQCNLFRVFRYIHELQNAVSTLTGKKLTIE